MLRQALPAPWLSNLGRCWWHARERVQGPAASEWAYDGFEVSLSLVSAVLKEQGPFDCLLGFSQGATLAALSLLALWDNAPRAAVVISGFRPRDPSLVARLALPPPLLPPHPRNTVRTLHVVGRRDAVVPAEESLALKDVMLGLGEAHTCEHRGGHGGWRRNARVQKRVCQFVLECAGS